MGDRDLHPSQFKFFQAPAQKLKQKTQSQRNRRLTTTDDSGLSDSGQQSPNNSLTSSDVAKIKDQKKKLSTFWSSPFGKSQEKEELLRSKLESWSNNCLPAMPDLIKIGKPNFDRSIFELPNNWQDVVRQQPLTKRLRDQQERVWELIKTEVRYILRLSVIKDLFMCCLINLQNEGVLNEIDSERVFSNILDVHEGNALLWQDHMQEVFLKSKEDESPLNPSFMKEGFQNISDLLHPYTKYCLEQEACQEYIKKKCQESELFKIFVEWCEAQKQCNRLKLTDLMVSPMHRLTRYKLLLEAIIKYTEDQSQKEDLLMMVKKVNSFAQQVDNAMRQKQEHTRLSKIISRIESYEFVESPTEECAKLITQYNKIDLTLPMQGCGSQQKRNLIKEGPLKLRDSTLKTEVHVFLFTDMLLLSKTKERKSDRVKVIKPPMRLDHVLVYLLKDGISFLLVHLNEFNVASAMYTLHGDATTWVEKIKKTQDDYRNLWKLNLERPETGLEYLNTSDEDDEYSADFNQVPDHMGLSRVESTSSVDVFIPNISHINRSNSHNTLVRNFSQGEVDRLRSSSPLHLNSDSDSVKRPRSATYNEDSTDPTRHSNSSHPPSLSYKSHSEASEDSFTGLSLPGAASSPRTNDFKSFDASRTNSVEDDTTSCARLPGRPDIFLEESRSKLANRRKSGAEKRYYTADHIQDLQPKEKDTSIHKRYSLNYSNNPGNERSTALHDKTISSDSLRSMPSSSGVSSTGSLHLSPDTDIYEECESENASVSSIRYIPPMTQIHDKISEEDPSNLSSTDSSSSQSYEAVKKFSKSLPDVSALLSLSKSGGGDGMGLVQLTKQDSLEKKKLTHAEMRKMTKNLLLNSTLEATEV